MSEQNQNIGRASWSSRLTYILTVAGATIGFGATWRFPYQVGANGGGAYVLVFILCMVLIGIPMILVENVIGRRAQCNAVDSFGGTVDGKKLSSAWKAIGWISIAGCFGIVAYYQVIGGWVVEYIIAIFRSLFGIGDMSGQLDLQHLAGLTKQEASAYTSTFYQANITNSPWTIAIYTMVFNLINWFILSLGIINGVERAVKFLMPFLFISLFLMVIRNITLDNAWIGIKFYLTPDFSKITPKLFISVLGQVFFALSIGFGLIITLSSYLKRTEPLINTSYLTVVINTIVAIMAGFMIFPGLFAFGLEPGSGPKLVFELLPVVFSKLPLSSFFGIVFFCLLLSAALTTSIIQYEILITTIAEKFKLNRQIAISIVILGCMLLGNLPSLLSQTTFDLFDSISANILFVLGAFGSCLFISYGLKQEAKEELLMGGYPHQKKITNIWFNYVKYVLPILIGLIFVFGMYDMFFTA